MTEEEAKAELFKINLEYMKHTPEERLKLYDEYKANRERVRKELAKAKLEKIKEKGKKL